MCSSRWELVTGGPFDFEAVLVFVAAGRQRRQFLYTASDMFDIQPSPNGRVSKGLNVL